MLHHCIASGMYWWHASASISKSHQHLLACIPKDIAILCSSHFSKKAVRLRGWWCYFLSSNIRSASVNEWQVSFIGPLHMPIMYRWWSGMGECSLILYFEKTCSEQLLGHEVYALVYPLRRLWFPRWSIITHKNTTYSFIKI